MHNRYSNKTTNEFIQSINNFKRYVDHFSTVIENDLEAQRNARRIINEISDDLDRRMAQLDG